MTTDTPTKTVPEADTSLLNEAQRIERTEAEHWDEHTLTKVEAPDPESEYTSYTVSDGSLCWGLDVPEGVEPPQVGDEVRVFSRGGFGTAIRGQDLRGTAIYYKTQRELDFDRAEMLLRFETDNAERYAKHKDKLDADYESLPQPFKDRLDRFRAEDPRFRFDGESYESFILVEAVKIAEHFGDADKVEAWRKMDDYTAQKAMYAVDPNHSGNTFGAAGAFAERLLRGLEV